MTGQINRERVIRLQCKHTMWLAHSHNTRMLHNDNVSPSKCMRDKNGEKEIKKTLKAYIIYDSMYGNTEKIAQAIGNGLTGEVKVVRVGEVNRPNSRHVTCSFLVRQPMVVFRQRRFTLC